MLKYFRLELSDLLGQKTMTTDARRVGNVRPFIADPRLPDFFPGMAF
jgi:hypothetical protein